jgi:hypothetical protein
MMKNIVIFTALIATIFASCDDRLTREFQDPEQHAPRTEEIVPGMLTSMLDTRFYVHDYVETYYHFMSGFGIHTFLQLAVYYPSPGTAGYWEVWDDVVSGDITYAQLDTRFNSYYTDLRNWAGMRDKVENMSEAELAENEMFFLAATVIKDIMGLQSVDMYNKIPYSEAFQGTKGIFFPKYDDGKDV